MPQDLIAGEELIAVFMERPYQTEADLKYHIQFNWIMPAARKILLMHWPENEIIQQLLEDLKTKLICCRARSIFEAVLVIVKWYNEFIK